MGEWNEGGRVSPEQMKLLKEFQDAEREAYAAWRRGEPPPEQRVFEARQPKHIYVGNRKSRRAQAAKRAQTPMGEEG